MPVHKDALEAALRTKLSADVVLATDTSDGCGQSFDVVVVSRMFEGKPLLARHRMVNDAIKDEIAQIHAFSQKTYTPEQYAALPKQ